MKEVFSIIAEYQAHIQGRSCIVQELLEDYLVILYT